jgi:hypothetical protein
MTGKALKEHFAFLGVENERFAKAWSAVRKELLADSRIAVEGSGVQTTFSWVAGEG